MGNTTTHSLTARAHSLGHILYLTMIECIEQKRTALDKASEYGDGDESRLLTASKGRALRAGQRSGQLNSLPQCFGSSCHGSSRATSERPRATSCRAESLTSLITFSVSKPHAAEKESVVYPNLFVQAATCVCT